MRQSIVVPGYRHSNPVPVASRIGNLIMSSVISAKNADTGFIPDSLEEQCKAMFANVRGTIGAAGIRAEDIIKMQVWLKDFYNREALNAEWKSLFPDPDSRPTRQVHLLVGKEGKSVVICDFIAVVQD